MKTALAFLLLFASVSPAFAMTATVYRPVVSDPNGMIFEFDPFDDMTKEECLNRLKTIETKPPQKALCLGIVVNREVS